MPLNPLTEKYRQYRLYQEIQDRLADVGGLNKYDEPNFILVWGQGGDENAVYRAGGSWEVEGIPSFTGYRNILVGNGTPSWCLMQWHAAEEYGTPESYYVMNYDEASGLQTLGEYPYSGRYQLLYNLRYVERVGSDLKFTAMPLNSYLLDTMIPIIKQARNISWEKTKAAMQELKEREDREQVNRIEDVMRDKAVPFRYSTTSFTKQGCSNSAIDKKVVSMLQNWNQIMKNARSMTKGFQVRNN